MELAPSESADPGTFEAIFHALDAASRDRIGPAGPRLLVSPIRYDASAGTGGLWAISLFGWMHVEMLLVPEWMRGQGVGSAMMALAETEARRRGCMGMHVDTF